MRYLEIIRKNKRLSKQLEKVEKGEGDYFLADLIADEISDSLSEAFDEITEEELPDGRMYFNIAVKVVEPLLLNAGKTMAGYLYKIQTDLNKKAGLNIKAVRIDEE